MFSIYYFVYDVLSGAKVYQYFSCTLPRDYYFIKQHGSTKLRRYKTKFSYGDFWNELNFRIVNELKHKFFCWRTMEENYQKFYFLACFSLFKAFQVPKTWNANFGTIEGLTMMFPKLKKKLNPLKLESLSGKIRPRVYRSLS